MKKKNITLIIAIIIFIIILGVLIINYINTPKVGSLIELNYSQLKEKINNEDTFILIVSQTTCSHCATYKPEVEQIAKNYGIDVYYIDYDKETDDNKKEFLDSLNLDGSTPITLFINDGKEKSILNRISGAVSKETVINKFTDMGFIE